MQVRQIDPALGLLGPPRLDRIHEGCRLRRLLASAIQRTATPALAMIPDRPFTHAQQPRHRALGMPLFQQNRHRRSFLISKMTHRPLPAPLPGNRSGQGDTS